MTISIRTEVANILEELRLREGVRWPKSMTVEACILEMAKKRGFVDD